MARKWEKVVHRSPKSLLFSAENHEYIVWAEEWDGEEDKMKKCEKDGGNWKRKWNGVKRVLSIDRQWQDDTEIFHENLMQISVVAASFVDGVIGYWQTNMLAAFLWLRPHEVQAIFKHDKFFLTFFSPNILPKRENFAFWILTLVRRAYHAMKYNFLAHERAPDLTHSEN